MRFLQSGKGMPAAARLRRAVFAAAFVLAAPLCANAVGPEGLQVFLDRYCLECHDSSVQKGEREFESFALPLKEPGDLITAQEIIDQLTLREMPPKKSDQPSDSERIAAIRQLRDAQAAARELLASTQSRTVMRRLTKREYETTLEALFGRRVDTLGLAADFPKERESGHLDNIGAALVTSGFLLDQYFQAAHRFVEARLNRPQMKPKDWHFDGGFQQYEELSGPHKSAFNYRYLNIYEQPNTDTRQGGYAHIEKFLEGVPVSGLYRIEVLAQAMHRDTHYDPAIFGIDFSEPFQLAIVPGDVTKGHIHYPQPIEPLLAPPVVVPDDKPKWIKKTVWLEGGQTPRFIFPNGPYESRAAAIQVNRRYKDEFTGNISSSDVSRTHILLQGKLPHIRISEIKIHGPLPEPGGGAEEVAVFGPKGFQKETALARLLAFAEKAFRRPLEDAEARQLNTFHAAALAGGAAPRQAALDTLKFILCSPAFLYLPEITPEDQTRLGAWDLASRISYALWSEPPDDLLRRAAASGDLLESGALEWHARRMLDDPRADRFIAAFLDSWLNLRELGSQPPARSAARAYYAEDLPASMKTEARLFFKNLLQTGGPVADFLTSDYTFVDKKLAKHYGLPEQETLRLADGFQRVKLADTRRRGGLLGMAAVLTVSANGVETSPVTRGVWVAENILGTPPPPPPDEVPPFDTDVRSAKTIREKLQMHSDSVTCAECHRKIDPLGFPLETFDPVGRWRDSYPKPQGAESALKVDPAGVLASGEEFSNFEEFKAVLHEVRREAFTRNLITKLLSYIAGRHMEVADQFEIDAIHHRVNADNGSLKTLVIACLTSRITQSR
jgi:hypothetical protein